MTIYPMDPFIKTVKAKNTKPVQVSAIGANANRTRPNIPARVPLHPPKLTNNSAVVVDVIEVFDVNIQFVCRLLGFLLTFFVSGFLTNVF